LPFGYGTNGANGPNFKGSNKVQPSRPFILVLFATEVGSENASEITWLRSKSQEDAADYCT